MHQINYIETLEGLETVLDLLWHEGDGLRHAVIELLQIGVLQHMGHHLLLYYLLFNNINSRISFLLI